MKYKYSKNFAAGGALLVVIGIILFLAVFFIRQYAESPKRARVPGIGLGCEIIKQFPFSDDSALKEWEVKVFKNKVDYRIEKNNGLSYVKASSDKAASALYHRINVEAKGSHRPVMMWKWRVEKFPVKTRPESLEAENEDDFAARVYVIFPAMFITNSKVLEYVWSETLPVGATGTSPYSKNIKLIVLEQGQGEEKKWFTEERDIYSDYVKLFGRPPEYNIGAIAFMTNTEHTETNAEAMYDDIQIGYKNGSPSSQE